MLSGGRTRILHLGKMTLRQLSYEHKYLRCMSVATMAGLPMPASLHDQVGAPRTLPFTEEACQCVKRHSPTPSLVHSHHIVPKYLGGADTKANLITLCPSGHYVVHDLIRKFIAADGVLPRGRTNRYLYDLAVRGYTGRKA